MKRRITFLLMGLVLTTSSLALAAGRGPMLEQPPEESGAIMLAGSSSNETQGKVRAGETFTLSGLFANCILFGFDSSVQLFSAAGPPPQGFVTFSANPVSTAMSFSVRVQTSPSTPPGTYPIEIAGQGRACRSYTPFVLRLKVKRPAATDTEP